MHMQFDLRAKHVRGQDGFAYLEYANLMKIVHQLGPYHMFPLHDA
jgi:hypothetical protein